MARSFLFACAAEKRERGGEGERSHEARQREQSWKKKCLLTFDLDCGLSLFFYKKKTLQKPNFHRRICCC